MLAKTPATANGWLAFELSILHRLNFFSVAIPFTGDPAIGAYLKRRRVRVTANDLLSADWNRSLFAIQNNSETLSDEDLETLLTDVYVPGYKLSNPHLRDWFSETDSWWFDNIRRNIENLDSQIKKAAAVTLVTMTGDYVHSFTEETRELRQPLSTVLRKLHKAMAAPVNNHQDNSCFNKNPDIFIAESTGDLMYLRLPEADAENGRAWREEWLRGGNDFWNEFETQLAGSLGSPVETKAQYLRMLGHSLEKAGHLKQWAISHVETGFVTAQEVADVIGKYRSVQAIYTKDFSELTGKKAVIITA